MLPNGNHDFTYLSLDCFHLSQKGYAIGNVEIILIFDDFAWDRHSLIYFELEATSALWNNMLQPEGRKSTNWKKEFTELICPTVDRPYIATKKNG